MVMVVEKHTDSVSVDIYIDGSIVLEGTRQAVDSQFALDDSVAFFLDDDGEEKATDVAQVVLYNYALTPAEVLALGDVPLPVELTSFTALLSGDAVILNWETATEVNNYGFEIEASTSSATGWKTIGFVSGHGNSNSPNSYSFTAIDGAKYYRLKQIDTDGRFEYSSVVEVEGSLSYKLSQNHPNPFNPTTVINFSIPESGLVTVKVYNALGQEVAELLNEVKTAGSYAVNFNGSNLSSGMYIYKISAGSFSATRKMMLLK
jgi:hypothetical protein